MVQSQLKLFLTVKIWYEAGLEPPTFGLRPDEPVTAHPTMVVVGEGQTFEASISRFDLLPLATQGTPPFTGANTMGLEPTTYVTVSCSTSVIRWLANSIEQWSIMSRTDVIRTFYQLFLFLLTEARTYQRLCSEP